MAAGKCVEAFYRPTILFSGDGDELVGSARSINGFSIFDALCECQHLLVKFGGHDMAAGITLKRENFDEFVTAISAYAKEHISEEQLTPTVKPDVLSDLQEITVTEAFEIEKLGPFGIGNRTPVVQVMSVPIDEVSAMGKEGNHLSMRVGKKRLRCVWWGQGKFIEKLQRGATVHLIGKIKVNEFRGNCTAELDLIDVALPSS